MSKSIPYPSYDPARLTIPPLESKNGGLFGKPSYTYKNGMTADLIFQLPVGKTSFGFSHFEDKKVPGKYSDSIAINYDVKSDFFKWSNGPMEKSIVDHAIKNKSTIFSTPYDDNIVAAFSNGIVRYAQDAEKRKTNAPTFKAGIHEMMIKSDDGKTSEPYNPRRYYSACEDINGKPMDIASVGRDSMVRMFVRLSNFYVINKKYGASWELVKCVVIQSGSNANIEGDIHAYPDEACFIPQAPIEDVYDNVMEDAIQAAEAEAEANKKRERDDESEPPKEEKKAKVSEPAEEEEESKPKKVKSKTTKKR